MASLFQRIVYGLVVLLLGVATVWAMTPHRSAPARPLPRMTAPAMPAAVTLFAPHAKPGPSIALTTDGPESGLDE